VKNKGYKKEKIFKGKEVLTNEEGTIYNAYRCVVGCVSGASLCRQKSDTK